MADTYPGKLQLWEGWLPSLVQEQAVQGRTTGGRADAFAARLFAAEALQADRKPREAAEPFTLQWFLEAESVRYGRHGKWLPRLLEFGKHSGECLLGLGDGLGADWVQYARCGAVVTACSPSADTLALVQRNFELRGLAGQFIAADPARLPQESASIDVACVSNLLHTAPDPAALDRGNLPRPQAGRQSAGPDAGPLRRRLLVGLLLPLARLVSPPGDRRRPAALAAAACDACSFASPNTASTNGTCAGRRRRTCCAGCRCRCWNA